MPSASRLSKKGNSFLHCPYCLDYLSAASFESHCSTLHALNTTFYCVWCLAPAVSHSVPCSALSIPSPLVPLTLPPRSSNLPTLFDLEPMCEEHALDGHPPIDALPPGPIWEVRPTLTGLTFQSPSLNLAAACVQLYLNTWLDTDFFHLMIRAPAYRSFLQAIDGGRVRTLPFSCFCTGGGIAHRHLLLVTTPKGYFEKQVWKTIKCRQKNNNIRKEVIVSPLQLVHLLGYVSQRHSQCDFTFSNAIPSQRGETRHYDIATALPVSYQPILASLWEGGLLELLYQQYALVEPQVLAPVSVSFNGLWGVLVSDLPGLPSHHVLPVSDHFQPTLQPTDFFVHLVHGEKLFFEPTDSPRQERWVEMQAEKGNVLFHRVGQTWFYPTPYQQRCITCLKPFVNRIQRLEWEVEEKETQLKKREESLQRVHNSIQVWKRKYRISEQRLKSLQSRHIASLERENESLRLKQAKGTES